MKRQQEYTPLESIEQQILANWLEINGYTFSAIRNESDTHSFYAWLKRKKSWVHKWVPDFMIILKRNSLLFIELKRQKKSLSKVSKEQKEWIKALNEVTNVEAVICYWAERAIELIQEYETK